MSRVHELVWEPAGRIVRAELAGTKIAESDGAFVLREGRLPPVVYFPLKDIRAEVLERTDHSTHCPFKGDASYWTVVVDGDRAENVLWAYENPIENAPYLQGYGAFYADRVTIT